MKDVRAFIKSNGLGDYFVENGAEIYPTKKAISKINKMAEGLIQSANSIAELIEVKMEEIALRALGTKAISYESVGRVYLSSSKEDRCLKAKMRASIKLSRDGKQILYNFASADAKGAQVRAEEMMSKDPLLAVFLNPSTLLYREDLMHAICLSVTVMNLQNAMIDADKLDEDLLDEIAKVEKGTPGKKGKLELKEEDLPGKAV